MHPPRVIDQVDNVGSRVAGRVHQADLGQLAALEEPAASPPELAEETKLQAAAPGTAPAVPATPASTPAANISLEVFGRISGAKPDQFAGFAWYAKRERLGPRAVVQWRDAFQGFLNRKVG